MLSSPSVPPPTSPLVRHSAAGSRRILPSERRRLPLRAALFGAGRPALAASLVSAAIVWAPILPGSAVASPIDKCLVGTAPEVSGDAAQVGATRSLIAAACPCVDFDGTPGKTRGSYGKCASTVIASQVGASQLRSLCAPTVKKLTLLSTCGLKPSKQPAPCIQTTTSSGKVKCSIKPVSRCRNGGSSTSVACPASTGCLDAADTNGDLLISAPGDDGACVATTGAPEEWRDAVLYFAVVDRFHDGDASNNGAPTPGVQPEADYNGGDWAGIRQKLEEGYFTDLGVNVLWLTVPVNNPAVSGANVDGHLRGAYHGTWPQALDEAEERFGTLAELQGLVTEAHALGIRIVLDWVMNHVHQSSPVYLEHPEWFWDSQVDEQSCLCGSPACPIDGPNVTRCWTEAYLPDFNYTIPEARNATIDAVVSLIQQTGVDGLRLDGVPYVEPAWISQLRSRVTADVEPTSGAHFLLLGDTRSAVPAALSPAVGPTMLDGQFDHPLRAQIVRSVLLGDTNPGGTMTALDAFLTDNDTRYGAALMGTFVGDPEYPRAVHFAQDLPLWSDAWADGKDRAWSNRPSLPSGTSAFQRLNNAFTILFTRPGIPAIQYGDEYGMAGAGEPDNRRMMQWSGHTAGQLLVHDHVRKLASIRAAHEALRIGTRTSLSSTDDTLVYRMHTANDDLYVAINRSNLPLAVTGLPNGTLTDLLTGASATGPSPILPARSSSIFVVP
jgi:glycosidase